MNTHLLRLVTFLAVALVAFAGIAQDDVLNRDFNIGGGGGGAGGCHTCLMSQSGSSISMSCGSPDPGEWGHDNCRIEHYPEGSYCFVDGNDCCVD